MMNEIADITPEERRLLSAMKRRPGMYFETTNLTNFEMWMYGYDDAMRMVNMQKEHNILPNGLNNFAAMEYLGRTDTPINCFGLVREANDYDESKAFFAFFELLDKYLVSLSYEPIPKWEDISDT